ncbi:quinone oxidoreductase family protein [Taibaiella koreensis]|uniref:quinone oxidoreductase family protein n=1 Tax=Taibaiella koreensis TaxID=1268548 RepID=UPI000E59B8CD|nr:zinc-binding alcohol dehydrogenase family protein [Taibaiella koreensis]
MKAAVSYPGNGDIHYADVPNPEAQQDNELLLSMRAAAIKHLDRSRASGSHYSIAAGAAEARIAGNDGVGLLEDGTRIYGVSSKGMMAELAVVEKALTVALPPGIDDSRAAALPNGVMGSAMALRFRARLQPGETVLINGATGFTGHIAVQVARHYGAGKIIVTGRNESALQRLLSLGAIDAISLLQDEAALAAQLRRIHEANPVDVVLDYLWGSSAALILSSLMGKSMFTHQTRFVSIGALSGDILPLSSEWLRSTDLQLSGSGLGSWSRAEVEQLFGDILPEMFRLAAEGKLEVPVETIALSEIAQLWDRDLPGGKRLVVTI